MDIPKIVKIFYNKSQRECLLVDKKDNLIYFGDIEYINFDGSFVVEWENSGPSGPWSRNLHRNIVIKNSKIPFTHTYKGNKYYYIGEQSCDVEYIHLKQGEVVIKVSNIDPELKPLYSSWLML